MGKFEGVKLTNKGLRLQAKLQTGAKLVFTSVVVGDGYLPDNADITTMTELINPVLGANTDIIDNKVIGDGYSQLEARITSGNKAFYLREIGIIATDPDDGDILYAYTNAGDYADFMPANTDNTTTQDIVLITSIGNADNVEVNVTIDAEVRKEEFNEHVNNKNNPHGVNAAQVGLENVDNVKQASKAEFDSHTANKSNPHEVNAEQVGLGNVDNTSDMDKPISTAVQEALSGKMNIKYLSTADLNLITEEGVYNITYRPSLSDVKRYNLPESFIPINSGYYGNTSVYLLVIKDFGDDKQITKYL